MVTTMLRTAFAVVLLLLLSVAPGCVSGNKIRADADVIKNDIERARRSGAYRCAPKELATAEANLDFALGELSQGSSFRASEHVKKADAAAKRAVLLSRDCGPKQVLVKEKPEEKPLVVKIEETDRDGDTIPDHTDQCPDEAEDRDGHEDEDGCPDPDNDGDGVPDASDRCPMTPGPASNEGCPSGDRDGDGVADHQDRCPDDPEDMDGYADEDGCPDPDNDGDGLVDKVDKCPDEAGPLETGGCPIKDTDGDTLPDHQDKCPTESGPVENQGCPTQDRDGDGLLDTHDKCPDQAGPPENGGCPVVDRDGDGLLDPDDKCPDEAGPKENGGCPDGDRDGDGIIDRLDKCPDQFGVKEQEGCPDPDRDGDGIVDRLDKCPDEFGIEAEGGCPKKYKTVVVKKDRIEISEQIKFKTGSHLIVGKPSQAVLDDVAAALNDNPQIKKVRIEGHTDSVGADTMNLRLSQRRADAVMAALIKRGVDPGRMEAVGFGEARPIASNGNASGRAENRRTEFNIVEQ